MAHIKRNPWVNAYFAARYRCTHKKCKSYHLYGGKGVKFLITKDEMKYLWFRDKAYLMKRPSIDRIDSEKHYELNNCRYIELKLNQSLGSISRWKKDRERKFPDGKVYCKRGHLMEGANIYYPLKGSRVCRSCRRLRRLKSFKKGD